MRKIIATIAVAAFALGLSAAAPVAARASASTTCPSDSPVCYHGGPVQFAPVVYLLLWGPGWQSDSKQETVAAFLDGFYSALGSQSGKSPDLLSTVTAQYYDKTGAPTFDNDFYEGDFPDSSVPPKGVTLQAIASKVDAFAAQQGLLDPGYPTSDVQIVVATQSGTCPQWFDGDGSICPRVNQKYEDQAYCGTHHDTPHGVPFVVLPYQNDSAKCGENSLARSVREGEYDGFSVTASHEFAETATDPLNNTQNLIKGAPNKPAWYQEIGDKCNPRPNTGYAFDETLDNGKNYAVQELWSNMDYLASGQGCTSAWWRMTPVFNPNGLWIATNSAQITSGSPVRVWGPNKGTIPPGAQFTHALKQLMVLGWCISDPGLGGAGTKLIYQRCGLHRNQLWTYNSTHNWYVLSANGLCLTDPADSSTNGTQLRLQKCADLASMQWTRI